VGFPRLRRKHWRRDSFRLTGSSRVHPRSVTLPRIGCVRTKETTGRLALAMVEPRGADRWYVSLAVEVARDAPQPVERRLRHRQHSRKQRGSRDRRQSAAGLARLHRCVRCQRADFLHQETTNRAQTILVGEDLSVGGMIRNRHLSRSIADSGWSECRRVLAYRTRWYGSPSVVAPRFSPSTKTRSACGHVEAEMPLGQRVFRCEACGPEIDRDLNAAPLPGVPRRREAPVEQRALAGRTARRNRLP